MKIISKKFLVVLVFISLGVLFFPSSAYALWPAIIGFGIAAIGIGSLLGMVPGVGGIVTWIGIGFGKVIAAVIIGIFSGLLVIPAILLQWSVDPWFIKYGYTTGGIVDIGWPVVRDLANMLIVLVLVIIGLATALRLGEYQARKTLPLLIGVALLINFTPVIMGVIVDFFNIIMNFFLEGFLGPAIIANSFSNMMGALTTKNVFDVTFWIELVFMGIFAILAGILFLLFALLFIMRRVAIWILVILSPIAFVAAILPATRGFFRFWWHQFFQWTIIGVVAAFFLWLGNHMISLTQQADFAASIEIGGDIQEMMNALAPFLVALILLYIGFFVSLSTSAMGASGIIAGAQGLTKKGTAWAGREAGARAARLARERALESKRVQSIGKRWAESPRPTEMGPSWMPRWARRGAAAAVATPIWTATREAGRTVTTRAQEAELADIRRLEGEAKKKWTTPESRHAALDAAGRPAERIAIIEATKEEGRLRHLRRSMLSAGQKAGQRRGLSDKEAQKEAQKEYEEQITKIGNEALKIHPDAFRQIRTAYPNLIERMREGIPEEIQDRARISDREAHAERYATVVRKVLGEMTPEEASRMDPGAYMAEKVKEAIHELWDGPKIAAAGRTIGKAFVDSFNEEMKKRGTDWYERNNPKALRYVRRTTAQELGFMGREEGLSEEEKRILRRGTETVPDKPQVPGPPPPEAPPPTPPRRPRGRPGVGGEPFRPRRERPTRPPRGRPGIG